MKTLLQRLLWGPSLGQPLGILIVDDEPEISEIWRTFLLPEHFSIHIARNSREARQKIRDERLDILLLDWRLDRNNGSSVMDEWMTYKKGPCMVVSGALDHTLINDLYSRGAFHVLQKPIEYQTLRRVVAWASELIHTRLCAERVPQLQRTVYLLIVLIAATEGPRAVELITKIT